MWLVHKQVGLFTHYLTPAGTFKPILTEAQRFSSPEMAEILAKRYSAKVQQISEPE
jgi:hypothetical protein